MLVAHSYLTLCDPMDCSPPDSSFHGTIQARILEWVNMPSFRRSSLWFFRQWSNLGLLYCRQILYHLSHQGNPRNTHLFIYVFIQPTFIVLSLCPTKSWGFCFVFAFVLVGERITNKVLEKRGHCALSAWNPKEWLKLTPTRESNHFQDHFLS